MAWTQADLDLIDAAIANTELLVAYDNGKVRYKDQRDMFIARNIIFNSIQAADGKVIPCMKVCNIVTTSSL